MKKTDRKNGRHPWRWAAALILPVGALGGWYSLESVTGPTTQWLEVEQDDLVLAVEVEGTLKAVESTPIGPPSIRDTWQFKIASMAPEGELVEKGAPVLTLDTTDLKQQLQQQVAERDAAHKRVEKRAQELAVQNEQDRLRLDEARAELRKSQLKAEAPGELKAARELEQIRLDLELAKKRVEFLSGRLSASERSIEATLGALRAQAEQADQEVADTERSIEEMVRLAPLDGTVIYVKNWRDEKKKVGDQCWRGENVIELPDLNRMKAAGQVHEADAGKVREGQRVKFRLDAHPDTEFTGRVASIWRTVQKESHSSELKVVRLEIELDTTDSQRMRPGMRYRGKIETDRIEQALVVDGEAVFLQPEGPVVYRKTTFGFEPVRVELGRRSQERVEVLEGLDVGDLIAATDLEREQG